MVDARLPDGSRVNAIIPPLAVDGPILSIRRFGATPLSVHNLLALKSVTPPMVQVLQALGQAKINILISGGYKVQGKTTESADLLKADALRMQAAGASVVLLEAIPAQLGKEVTELLAVPTIGIGAGPDCSGQVLVMHDLLGVFPGRKARFVKNFMDGQTSIDAAITAYVGAVKDGSFPALEHCF